MFTGLARRKSRREFLFKRVQALDLFTTVTASEFSTSQLNFNFVFMANSESVQRTVWWMKEGKEMIELYDLHVLSSNRLLREMWHDDVHFLHL